MCLQVLQGMPFLSLSGPLDLLPDDVLSLQLLLQSISPTATIVGWHLQHQYCYPLVVFMLELGRFQLILG